MLYPYHPNNIPSVEALLADIRFINDRIEQGDIISPKHALPVVQKMIDKMKDIMICEGATDIFLKPHVAGGGWIGIIVSYKIKDYQLEYSITPRRIGYHG
jgi:hypothetical protein